MVTTSGFVFPPGQSSMTYQGITVTDQQGTRAYGSGNNGTTQHGNIGFAALTFGDAHGLITTAMMPVFLYYSITRTTSGQPLTGQPWQGIFGVNDSPNGIILANSTATVGALCSPQSTGSCFVISALKYLSYASGINAGFMLTPTPLQACNITLAGSCSGAPVLTVGLTQALEAGFSTVSLACPGDTANGYLLCQQTIPDSTISVSTTETGTMTGSVLFDTGTPFMQLDVPSGTVFPSSVPAGTDVLVMLPSGFSYSYTAGTGASVTDVVSLAGPNIIGIGYFTTNSYFVDFTSSTAGWK